MKIVQSVKDTGASGQADSRRKEYLLPAVHTDSIFAGERQSKILILRKLQQPRLLQTRFSSAPLFKGSCNRRSNSLFGSVISLSAHATNFLYSLLLFHHSCNNAFIRGNLGSKMGLIRKRTKISFCELEFKNQ